MMSITDASAIAGCGKTVISSTIIDNLWKDFGQDSKASIAYFYFDFTEEQKQNVEECLRSFLRQLSAKKLPAVVKALYKQAQERSAQPGLDVLTDTFKAVLQQTPLTFLAFDALDECKEVKNLMEKIAEIRRWELPGVRILATSRREPDIIETMDVLLPLSICLETASVDEDIKAFVRQSLERDGPLKRRWSSNVKAKQEIEDAFAARSKGM
jgi:NACHT domain